MDGEQGGKGERDGVKERGERKENGESRGGKRRERRKKRRKAKMGKERERKTRRREKGKKKTAQLSKSPKMVYKWGTQSLYFNLAFFVMLSDFHCSYFVLEEGYVLGSVG